ncbi:MarR family winged helix-turn-helix transcriptional regulator [Sphingomonas sp.]|uniref:MarR family winged helix-turn-helix transcriptional regulator n=1 Tax=Sphingomonas sp. TaxID=28214 RepID=UPI003B3A7BF0
MKQPAARAEQDQAPIREKHDGALTGRSDVRVWLRLLSCSTVIEKRLRRRFIEQYDTTLPRFDVLALLDRHPEGVTMSALSSGLLVSNGNVTSLVRQLENDGFVVSRPAAEDRRSSIVALSDRGQAHFVELARAHHRWIEAMFAGMKGEDQMALYSLLAMLKESIAREGGTPE